MSKIVYLAHYDFVGGDRVVFPAGTTVMEYVTECINATHGSFTLLSSARKKTKTPREEIDYKGNKVIFVKSPAIPSPRNKPARFISRAVHQRRLYKELMRILEDGDTLLVYHSLLYMDVVKRVIRRKRISLVMQVCEIYADVIRKPQLKEKEIEYCRLSDRFIFQSEQLNALVNNANKPYAILHGTFRLENRIESPEKKDENIVRCVYAGTLEMRKGSGAAAAAAEFLPENYEVHILGFGSADSVERIKATVAEVSARSKCKLTYDGCLSGEDYLAFLQSCDIGLCTQDPAAAFNATSFPSKILVYIANGLKVVTIKLPAIENSLVGEKLFYYEDQQPEKIARAIMEANKATNYDTSVMMKKLDSDFKEQLNGILMPQ